MQTLKNGAVDLKLRRLSTYASKYALIPQYSKMSSGFGNLWDTQGTFWATHVLKLNFRLIIVSFDKRQGCSGKRPAVNIE